jgi:hypothetical protein
VEHAPSLGVLDGDRLVFLLGGLFVGDGFGAARG